MCKRILVVDNDERVLFVFQKALVQLNRRHVIETARGGKEALDKMAAKSFDLVITELALPDMDGIELTEAISALDSGTVVVWTTVYGCQGVAREALRLHVSRCLNKPAEIGEIRRVAGEVLENR